MKRWHLAALVLTVGVCGAAPARAAGSQQRAAAETLFQQARQLMEQKSYAEACEKFAGSQELDPGLGTMLHLADCYDSAGKTASAWASFRDAATTAKRSGDVERERIASERATNLEARLSKLELDVTAGQVSGFELRLNGAVIPRASWDTPLPVDPGPVSIEATAAGARDFRKHVTLPPGPALERVLVPRLQLEAPAPSAKSPAPGPLPHARTPAPTTSAQRTWGYVTGVVGLVALGVGSYLGYRAYALNQDSKGACRANDANACTASGVQQRRDAQRFGNWSTGVSAGGAVFLLGGVALVLTSPSTDLEGGAERHAFSTLASPGAAVRGTW